MQEALKNFYLRNIFEIRHDVLKGFLGPLHIGKHVFNPKSHIQEAVIKISFSDGLKPGGTASQLRELLNCSALKKVVIEIEVHYDRIDEAWEALLEIVGVCKSLNGRIGAGLRIELSSWEPGRDILKDGPAFDVYGMKRNEITFLLQEPEEEIRRRVDTGEACKEEILMVTIMDMEAALAA